MTRSLLIVGSGGHAKVTADALLAAGETVRGFVDTDLSRHDGRNIFGLPVLGEDIVLEQAAYLKCDLVNGIGGVGEARDIPLRRLVQERLEARGRRFVGVRHPSAIVSRFAEIHATAQLFARSVIQPGAEVGRGCIVNTGATVEHDCRVGEFTHCAPGSLVCGDVILDENSHIGAGAVVRQGLRLEGGVVVGAGSVVIHSYTGRGPLVGVPARDLGMK